MTGILNDLAFCTFHARATCAVGGNAVPVSLDQGGELLIGFQALPLELRAPVFSKNFRAQASLV